MAMQVGFHFTADASEIHLRRNHIPFTPAQDRPPSTHRLDVETSKQVAPIPRVKDGQYSEPTKLLSTLEMCVSEAQHSRVPQNIRLPPRELAQDLSLLLMSPASLQVFLG